MKKIEAFFFGILVTMTVCFSAEGQTHDLNYFLKNAAANSPLLKDYQNQIKAGGLDSMMIRAAQRPLIAGNGQVMVAPTYHGYGYDKAITNGGDYTAILSVTQPIFNKNRLMSRYKGVSLQNQAIENSARISLLDLRKNVSAQYITAYADYRQLQSNLEVQRLLEAQQELLKRLVQGGIYKETDFLNYQVALQSQGIAISQLQMQYRADLSMLNYLCGINDTSSSVLVDPDISYHEGYQKSHSAFFRQFEVDSLKILNNRAVIDSKYHPVVNWFGDAGLESSSLSTMDRNFGASFGLNLSVPIYDGRQRRLEYQRLNIEEDTRSGYASFFDRQYEQQKAMLQQQLKASESLVTQIEQKLKSSQRLIDLDKKQLEAGEVPITEFILAINNYLSIRGNLNQAEISLLRIINELNYWNH